MKERTYCSTKGDTKLNWSYKKTERNSFKGTEIIDK